MNQKRRPKDYFFLTMAERYETLTYDDVLMAAGSVGPSELMPHQVHLESKFSQNVPLRVPITSAAMDTVTEYRLAITMAELGGMGIIHRNLTATEQARQVARVKHAVHGLVPKPICVPESWTMQEVRNMQEKKDYKFDSFPVLDSNGKLTGVLTSSNFEFCDNYSETVRAWMTKKVVTATEGTTIDEAYKLMQESRCKLLPIVSTQDKSQVTALYTWVDVKKNKTGARDMHNTDDQGQLRVGAAIGTGESELERVALLVKEGVDVIVIDTAHGDSNPVYQMLKEVKEAFSKLDVVVGNVSESWSAKRLAEAGANGIKVGQGPGSICTTRVVSGIGCPQATAVYQCSEVAEEYDIPVCADGGIRYSGHIPIAIAIGAHSVMIGRLFAGVDESPGDLIHQGGRVWKECRGMGSLKAMTDSAAARGRYQENNVDPSKLVPEGLESRVDYSGPLSTTMHQLIGGLRKGMGYVGAQNIEELRTKVHFNRIFEAGQAESHPHDVEVTEEAPNYSSARRSR